jgi:hypothetical protein
VRHRAGPDRDSPWRDSPAGPEITVGRFTALGWHHKGLTPHRNPNDLAQAEPRAVIPEGIRNRILQRISTGPLAANGLTRAVIRSRLSGLQAEPIRVSVDRTEQRPA